MATEVEQNAGALAGVRSQEMRQALLSLFMYASDFVSASLLKDPRVTPHVVLVSRRLSCVYSMLCDSGEIEPLDLGGRCDVVFDRVVEQAPDWNSDDPVLLIDDVLIFGETLRRRNADLLGAGVDASRIEVRVAAYRDGADPQVLLDLALLESGPLSIDVEAANEFASDIATCLYRSQTPYFTDFPMTGPLMLAPSEVEQMLSSPRWIAANVTLPVARDGQEAYTLLPCDDVEDVLSRRTVPAAWRLVGFSKVRLFIDPVHDGYRRVRVVPIGVATAATQSQLDAAITQIRAVTSQGLAWDKWTNSAKHRLVQMYLSALVLDVFWSDLEGAAPRIGSLTVEMMDLRHVRSYFGSQSGKVAEAFAQVIADKTDKTNIARSDVSQDDDEFFSVTAKSEPYKYLPLRRELAKRGYFGTISRMTSSMAPPSRPPAGGSEIDVSHIWAQMLLHTWAVIARDYQERARGAVLADPSDQSKRDLYSISRHGFVMDELVSLLLPWLAESSNPDDVRWATFVMSLVLDIGNDMGIVVPSTRDEQEAGKHAEAGPTGHFVYRQFRTGENAYAAETDIWSLPSDPKKAIRRFDSYLRSIFKITSESWDHLPRSTQAAIVKLIDTAKSGDRIIAQGELQQAWDLTVDEVDDDLVYATGFPLTDDITDNELRFPRDGFPRTFNLQVGTRFMWYQFGPSEQCSGPSSRFEALTESGR